MITDESILIIAEKLGMSATHIYDVFVAAQPILALIHIICGIVIGICIISGYILAKKYIDENDLPAPIGALLGMFVGLILHIFLFHILKYILLPEYSAITELIGLIA